MLSSAMIPVKMDQPAVQCTSRWEYFSKAIPMWRRNIIGKVMYPTCFVLACAFLLWNMPILAVVSFGGTGYFYYQHIFAEDWLTSPNRKVMMAK